MSAMKIFIVFRTDRVRECEYERVLVVARDEKDAISFITSTRPDSRGPMPVWEGFTPNNAKAQLIGSTKLFPRGEVLMTDYSNCY
jgi:hypothetical protein